MPTSSRWWWRWARRRRLWDQWRRTQRFGDLLQRRAEPERFGGLRTRVPRLRRTRCVSTGAPQSDHGVHRPARRFARGVLHDRIHRVRRTSLPGPRREAPTERGRHRRSGSTASGPNQHAAHTLPHRARRDGHRPGARPRRRLVAGAVGPSTARGRRAHSGLHRGGEPRPAGARCRQANRGRPAGPGTQRDARADPDRLLGPGGLGGQAEGERATPAPVRGRRVARAPHTDRRGLGLRRVVRTGRLPALGGSPSCRRRDPHRDGEDGPSGERPLDPGPPRRGDPDAAGSGRAGWGGLGSRPHCDRSWPRVAGHLLGRPSGRGDRGRGSSAPGPRQSVGQRACPHSRRHDLDRPCDPDGQPRRG